VLPEWVKELGLPEEIVVIDFGPCPWCGQYAIHVAKNERAVGRRPPVECCVPGALAEMARVQKALRMVKDPQEKAWLQEDLRRAEEALRNLRPSKEEVEEAVLKVRERGYSIEPSIVWGTKNWGG